MFEGTDYKWVLAFLAALISFCNLLYYLSTVARGKTKPHLYSWLIWGIVTAVAAVTQITNDGGVGSFFTVLASMNCFAIVVLALFKGSHDIHFSDKICLAGCLIAVVLWPLTATPLLSLLIVTFIDTAGFYPTFRKAYSKPFEENIVSFTIYGLTYSLGILALESYSVLTTLYPAAIIVMCWSLVIFLLFRRKALSLGEACV